MDRTRPPPEKAIKSASDGVAAPPEASHLRSSNETTDNTMNTNTSEKIQSESPPDTAIKPSDKAKAGDGNESEKPNSSVVPSLSTHPLDAFASGWRIGRYLRRLFPRNLRHALEGIHTSIAELEERNAVCGEGEVDD